MNSLVARFPLAASALSLFPFALARAQGAGTAPADSQPRPAQSAPAAAAAPPLGFSGVIFGRYEVRTDAAARAGAGGNHPSQFSVDRVYLTFRMPAGDRMSIRATTDIVQQANGWGVRLKYGYLQANVLNDIAGRKGFSGLARIGVLHTVMIEHEESFWPRYLGSVAVERFGFFSSADLGAAAQVSLPAKLGEVYATVTNGPGYATPENDRFKDLAMRLTLTPFARTPGWRSTFALSPWVYRGATASRFVTGGAGQVGPVPDALARNRWGIVAGVRDPRLTLAAHYARRTEEVEAGANTLASPRSVASNTGELRSVHGVARPLAWRWGRTPPASGWWDGSITSHRQPAGPGRSGRWSPGSSTSRRRARPLPSTFRSRRRRIRGERSPASPGRVAGPCTGAPRSEGAPAAVARRGRCSARRQPHDCRRQEGGT